MDYVQLKSGMVVPANFAEAIQRPEGREIATTDDGRDVTRGYVSPMHLLGPQDSVLLKRGNGSYEIYREVLRDWQVKSTLQQRQLAVVARTWEVEPGGDRPLDIEAAEFLKQQLKSARWDGVTAQMLYGVFYGYAVAEILWGQDGSYITIDKIKVRDRRRFAFDGSMNLRLMTSANMNPGEILPERKFWTFCTGADHDDEPYGLGLAHWLYWPVFFKRNGIKFWLIFLEKFGNPTAKGTYPGGASADEKRKLLEALQAISTDTGVIIPEGMAIELIEAARSGAADYKSMNEVMDQAIAKVVLGHAGSSESTPGKLGGEDNARDVRQDLIKADADLVCESFNDSVAKWLTEWNFPGAALPRVFRQIDEGEDLEKMGAAWKILHEMGYEPDDIEQINETFGGRWKKKEPPKPANAPKIPADPLAADFAEAPAAVAAAVAEQLALETGAEQLAAQWQEILGPRVKELMAFAEESGDLVTFRERLVEMLKGQPSPKVVESLERAGFTAQLMGLTAGSK